MNYPPNQYGPPGPPSAGYPPQGGGYGAPPPGYAPPRPQYEFTPAQNEIIQSAATAAKGLGILQYIQAVLNLLGFNVIATGIAFVLGWHFHKGGTALQLVVDTQGNDIRNLMEALDKLAGVFMIRLILALLAVFLFAIVALTMGAVIVAALAEVAGG